MSLVFSDTNANAGIIQAIERRLFGDNGIGRITGSAALLKSFTADVNLAFSRVLSIIFKADGTWQYDDTNHTDYPIITTNLEQGQRDYPFTEDGSGNLVLHLHKVSIKRSASAATYEDIRPFDELDDRDNAILANSATQGIPQRYGKLANGIFLEVPTSYSAPNGLQMFVSREQTFFAVADTSKKPGFSPLYHEYLVLRPVYDYATRPGSNFSGVDNLRIDMLKMEKDIEEHYARRAKDERHIMTSRKINFI